MCACKSVCVHVRAWGRGDPPQAAHLYVFFFAHQLAGGLNVHMTCCSTLAIRMFVVRCLLPVRARVRGRMSTVDSVRIHPWIDTSSNHLRPQDMTRPVMIPDVCPGDVLAGAGLTRRAHARVCVKGGKALLRGVQLPHARPAKRGRRGPLRAHVGVGCCLLCPYSLFSFVFRVNCRAPGPGLLHGCGGNLFR